MVGERSSRYIVCISMRNISDLIIMELGRIVSTKGKEGSGTTGNKLLSGSFEIHLFNFGETYQGDKVV